MSDESKRSFPRAWQEVGRRGAEMAKARWSLLSAEMAEKRRGWAIAFRWIGAGLAAGIAAYLTGLALLVWLAFRLAGSVGWGLLLAFALAAGVAVSAGSRGRWLLKKHGIVPEGTISELRRDVEALRHRWKENEPGPETD